MTERELLLERIATICYNGKDDVDPLSLTGWSEMPIEELRTVVILLNDEMIHLLQSHDHTRGHCHLLESLYVYITTDLRAKNLLTNSPITSRQRGHIIAAYHAIHPDRFVIREYEQALEQEFQRQEDIWDNIERITARMTYIDKYINDHVVANVVANDSRDLFTEFLLLWEQSQEQFELLNRQRERVRLAQRRLDEQEQLDYQRRQDELDRRDEQQRRQAELDQEQERPQEMPRDVAQNVFCTIM